LPTKNFYWDGVSFAQTIENAVHWPMLLHPNHLLYNALGWASYHAFGGRVRALYVLQALDSACAAAAFYLLSGIVARVTGSARMALLLGALFAFSGTWWRFATDADAYIPSVLLLIASASFLLKEKPRTVPAALLHCGAMLLHQLAVFFFPAALVLLWQQRTNRRWRRCALYLSVAGGVTLTAYIAAFSIQSGGFSLNSFCRWITSHSDDVAFSFTPGKNLAISIRSWAQVMLAGRPSLVRYSDPLTIALLILCAGALVFFVVAVGRRHRPRIAIYHPVLFAFSVSWIATYALFLFVWLPHNTFYKLFALPGIILLIASCSKPGADPSIRGPAIPLAAAIAVFNLTFAIIPYSRVTANEAVAFAFSLEQHLASGATVYFSDLNTDDWLVRYFNPQTSWRQVASSADVGAGWLDTTAIDRFSRSDPAWLEKRTRHAEWRELVNAKHRIRFVRLLPLTTEPDAERTAPRARYSLPRSIRATRPPPHLRDDAASKRLRSARSRPVCAEAKPAPLAPAAHRASAQFPLRAPSRAGPPPPSWCKVSC
jgi:hypothetical protein